MMKTQLLYGLALFMRAALNLTATVQINAGCLIGLNGLGIELWIIAISQSCTDYFSDQSITENCENVSHNILKLASSFF